MGLIPLVLKAKEIVGGIDASFIKNVIKSE
jgi:hypothetical protein